LVMFFGVVLADLLVLVEVGLIVDTMK
jgi:hypothetical protein